MTPPKTRRLGGGVRGRERERRLRLQIQTLTSTVGAAVLRAKASERSAAELRIINEDLTAQLARDKAALERSLEGMRAGAAHLRALWQSSVIGIFNANGSGAITDANDTFLRMLDYTREDLEAGRINWKQMTPPEYFEVDLRATTQGLEHGVCSPYEKVYLGKHGRRVPVLLGTSQIDDDILSHICFIVDLTARKRVEREREVLLSREQTARVEAERLSRMKDEFASILSHELHTPLNAILGWTTFLQRPGIEASEVVRGLEVIERHTRLQAQLISDLLDVSGIIAGKLRFEPRRVELGPILETAIDGLGQAAKQKKIVLAAAIPAPRATVLGDPGRVHQIISNLVANAIKFSEAGSTVDIALRVQGDHAEIVVRDRGEGFSAELAPHLFDRFRQADASTSRRHGGLGLGLSIVKHLVELHGGTVRAESDGPGLGATFTVALPLG